jgi:diadenosine tetraphosphate (Ap4A) HIT family hydrolase
MARREVPFVLDDRLAADTVAVVRWPLCRVLLNRDATYPWLILVPARPGLRDLDDVGPADRAPLFAEIARASKVLKALHAPDKINVAALGNVVAQLHVHVIARRRGDPAWPNPVWNTVPRRDYAPAALDETRRRLADLLGAAP